MKFSSIVFASIVIVSASYGSPKLSIGVEQGFRPSEERNSGDTTFFSYGDFIVGLNIELQNRRNIVNWFSWTPTYFVGIDYQRILPKHREVNWLIAKGAAGLCFSMNIFRNKMSLYFGPNIGEAYNFKINERESLFGPQFRSHFVALTSLDYGLRVNFKKSSISLGGNSIHYFSEEKDNATNWGIKYGFDL